MQIPSFPRFPYEVEWGIIILSLLYQHFIVTLQIELCHLNNFCYIWQRIKTTPLSYKVGWLMKQQYLNEFHMHNSLACQRDQKAQAQQPLTIEAVLQQSRKLGRTSIRLTTSGQAIYKTIWRLEDFLITGISQMPVFFVKPGFDRASPSFPQKPRIPQWVGVRVRFAFGVWCRESAVGWLWRVSDGG